MSDGFRSRVLLFAVWLATPSHAAAQAPPARIDDILEPFAAAKDGKLLRARRIQGSPPAIDGRLDDEVWTLADTFDDLVQWEPDNMAPASERTVTQVVYDDRYLYVAVRCYDRFPVSSGFGRRDNPPGTADTLSVGFDPRHDHQTSYIYETNPAAVQSDMSRFNDVQIDRDYDAVWEVQTEITGEGWTVEFRIPFSQMRFSVDADRQPVWGFNVRRVIRRRAEQAQWVGQPRGEAGNVSRYGHLVFESGLPPPPRRIELLPYVLGHRTTLAGSTEGEHGGGAGLDLRLGVGSATTLSATINPDFAQVELDPAVLNLTVFETFFPEKRPFFLEDSRTFLPPYGLFQLFHSRRIGRTPDRLPVPQNERVVERPDQTTILGAAKLTGKASHWTYGALTALTAREYADVELTAVGGSGGPAVSRARRMVEPRTSYNVVRLQRDLLNGSSNVGGLATAVVREQAADAFTGGVDYSLRWDRNLQGWNGHWAASKAPGPGGVKTGFGGVTNYNFNRKHGGIFVHFDHFSPNFRINDIGFHRNRVDRTDIDGGFSVGQPDPWGVFRRVGVFLGGGQAWNTDGLVFSRFANGSVSLQFRNFWSINTNVGRQFRVLDDLDTRGGPPIVDPATTFFNMFVNSDSRKTWRMNVGMNASRDTEDSWSLRVAPALDLQPSPRWQTSIGLGYTAGDEVAQWITNRDVTGDGAVDHVYGRLRRDVLDVTLRTTYALHRDMTFQVYLQPFVAVGDYTDIKRLASPRSFEFAPATLPFHPDFNTKSLRGNVVFRWEYVRGSTLFLVWNLSAIDRARPGVFTPLRDLGDAFSADGTHAFMVKMNYWFSR